MSEDSILAELRAIRDLMILKGGEEIDALPEGLGEQHVGILSELETGEWTFSSNVLPAVADEAGVTKEAVRQKKDHLIERKLIQQRGRGNQTEYRKTGLGIAAERALELTNIEQ